MVHYTPMNGTIKEIGTMHKAFLSLKEVIATFGYDIPFAPIAYYSKNEDKIYVQIKDCSILEEYKNKYLSIMHDSHTYENIGFVLSNVSVLFDKFGMGRDIPYSLDYIFSKLEILPYHSMIITSVFIEDNNIGDLSVCLEDGGK